jgi:hypothetical protein
MVRRAVPVILMDCAPAPVVRAIRTVVDDVRAGAS